MSMLIQTSSRVGIRRPSAGDCEAFLALVHTSRGLHRPWADPPDTEQRFADYLQSRQGPGDDGFLICARDSGQLLGVVNLNCIVRRAFQSAFLGYYAHADFAGRGFMTEGLQIVTRYAFTEMGLHRLEANIQPENAASIALVKKCGFRKEGFSPRYLRVAGQWRDHERWALLADSASLQEQALLK
jgi:[ribosomal protein S5]-alanine N-acetyltransferase